MILPRATSSEGSTTAHPGRPAGPAAFSDPQAATPAAAPIASMYVHVPFCTTICGYCDFYVQRVQRGAADPLVDALLRELASYQTQRNLNLNTIFVGGGTPTTLAPDTLRRLLSSLRAAAGAEAGLEFSIEVNPATVSPRVAGVLAETGVTRVSIGAQSFHPQELVALERTHTPQRIAETVARCRAVGIPQVSLDLIYSIPGQTLAAWRANLAAAIALRPDHISCYALTYEENTPFHRRLQAGDLQRTPNDLEADMFEATIDDLAAAGFVQYEISNFARPGCECRHNLTYWHNDSYIGLGPSACGYVDGVRYKNVPDLAGYVSAIESGASVWVSEEALSPKARAREAAMLRLRLRTGIDREDFQRRYGLDPFAFFFDAIGRNVSAGLLQQDEFGIRLTRAGLLLADRVARDFL